MVSLEVFPGIFEEIFYSASLKHSLKNFEIYSLRKHFENASRNLPRNTSGILSNILLKNLPAISWNFGADFLWKKFLGVLLRIPMEVLKGMCPGISLEFHTEKLLGISRDFVLVILSDSSRIFFRDTFRNSHIDSFRSSTWLSLMYLPKKFFMRSFSNFLSYLFRI